MFAKIASGVAMAANAAGTRTARRRTGCQHKVIALIEARIGEGEFAEAIALVNVSARIV